jgi:hypothetical protein
MINSIKTYSLMGLCLILLFLLLLKSCELEKAKKHVEVSRVPDTVYVAKPYKVVVIQKQYIEKPVKVIVYLKDTTLRKQAERSEIITRIDFKRHNLFHKKDFLKVDKINPQGIVFSNEYNLEPVREIKIGLNGDVEVKKKRHLGLKIVGSIIAGGISTYFIGQQIHK